MLCLIICWMSAGVFLVLQQSRIYFTTLGTKVPFHLKYAMASQEAVQTFL